MSETCHESVHRHAGPEVCERPAIGYQPDPEGGPDAVYPVCRTHADPRTRLMHLVAQRPGIDSVHGAGLVLARMVTADV